jgi:hypothetical protein
MKKNKRLELRVSPDEKAYLKEMAGKHQVSLSEAILQSMRGKPVNEREIKAERFERLIALTKELNYIGKNINQLTKVLWSINAGGKIENGEFGLLSDELKRCNEVTSDLYMELKKITFIQ